VNINIRIIENSTHRQKKKLRKKKKGGGDFPETYPKSFKSEDLTKNTENYLMKIQKGQQITK
jgi:hypothetical protein